MLVCHEWGGISWIRSHVFHHRLALSSLIFFLVLFWANRPVFPSSSLVILLIHSAFSLYLFGCHILVHNSSVSFIPGCWYVFVSLPPNFWYNFLSLFWNVLFCLYCFTLCRYLFNLPSLASTFWFISSSSTVIFPPVTCSFFSLISPSLFLIIRACFRSLGGCVSSRISHTSFDCYFVYFDGIPIVSRT